MNQQKLSRVTLVLYSVRTRKCHHVCHELNLPISYIHLRLTWHSHFCCCSLTTEQPCYSLNSTAEQLKKTILRTCFAIWSRSGYYPNKQVECNQKQEVEEQLEDKQRESLHPKLLEEKVLHQWVLQKFQSVVLNLKLSCDSLESNVNL